MTPTAEYLLPDKCSKNISVSFASQSVLMSTCLYLCFGLHALSLYFDHLGPFWELRFCFFSEHSRVLFHYWAQSSTCWLLESIPRIRRSFHCVSLLCNALRSHCTELIGHCEEISDGQIDPNLITRAYVGLSSWELSENIFQSYSVSPLYEWSTKLFSNPSSIYILLKTKGSWVQTHMVCTVCTILTSLKVNIW